MASIPGQGDAGSSLSDPLERRAPIFRYRRRGLSVQAHDLVAVRLDALDPRQPLLNQVPDQLGSRSFVLDVIVRRWQSYTGDTARHVETGQTYEEVRSTRTSTVEEAFR